MNQSTSVIAGVLYFDEETKLAKNSPQPMNGISENVLTNAVFYAEPGEEGDDVLACHWVNVTDRTIQGIPAASIVGLDGSISDLNDAITVDYEAAMRTLRICGEPPMLVVAAPAYSKILFHSPITGQIHLAQAAPGCQAALVRIAVCDNRQEHPDIQMVDWVNLTANTAHGVPPMTALMVTGEMHGLTVKDDRMAALNGKTLYIREAAATRTIEKLAANINFNAMMPAMPTMGVRSNFYPLTASVVTVHLVPEETLRLLTSRNNWTIHELLRIPFFAKETSELSRSTDLAIALDLNRKAYVITQVRDLGHVSCIVDWVEVARLNVDNLKDLLECLPAYFYRTIDFDTIKKSTDPANGFCEFDLDQRVRRIFSNLACYMPFGFDVKNAIGFINAPESYRLPLLAFLDQLEKLCARVPSAMQPGIPPNGQLYPMGMMPQQPHMGGFQGMPQMPLYNNGIWQQQPVPQAMPGGIFPGLIAPAPESKPKAKAKRRVTPRGLDKS